MTVRKVPLTKTLDGYEFDYTGRTGVRQRRLVFNPRNQVHLTPTNPSLPGAWYIRDLDRAQAHDQPVGALADAKDVLRELMDELDGIEPSVEARAPRRRKAARA